MPWPTSLAGIAGGALGDHDHAIADYTEAIHLKPDNADAYYNRGCSRWQLGEDERADADFEEAARLDPK